VHVPYAVQTQLRETAAAVLALMYIESFYLPSCFLTWA
jgi:hypothetical protein